MTPTTIQLFTLLHQAGNFDSTSGSDVGSLLEVMQVVDSLRETPQYIEFFKYRYGDPIGHISMMPCTDDGHVFSLQLHCSIVPGTGIRLLADVHSEIKNRDDIAYVLGLYSLTNPGANHIWDSIHAAISDESVCSLSKYVIHPHFVTPVCTSNQLYTDAFKSSDFNIKPLAGLPIAPYLTPFSEGDEIRSILFKVCAKSRTIFNTWLR